MYKALRCKVWRTPFARCPWMETPFVWRLKNYSAMLWALKLPRPSLPLKFS
jgi:hypothetical protein